MTSVTELQKEIHKTRSYLHRLVTRYLKTQTKVSRYSERERVEQVKRELLKRFPNMTFSERDERLLRLVGTLPYVPLGKEKEEIARAIAAEYA